MKIEKISENQIRCTLTKEDLDDRHIKLSELAYGTEKAKDLFREMMRFASTKYGFEADDIPLMIEAVPISSDMIILIITKVDYPEELDTRYANFSEDDNEDDFDFDYDDEEDYDVGPASAPFSAVPTADTDIGLFRFASLDVLFQAAEALQGIYDHENSLWKKDQQYYIILQRGDYERSAFQRICNILSEYGSQEFIAPGTETYFQEHASALIENDALQRLATV